MHIIRNGVQSDHFDGKQTPVFKKSAQVGERQSAGAQLGHKGAMIDFQLPVPKHIGIKLIDVSFGLARVHRVTLCTFRWQQLLFRNVKLLYCLNVNDFLSQSWAGGLEWKR
jgi:hypothetical protein